MPRFEGEAQRLHREGNLTEEALIEAVAEKVPDAVAEGREGGPPLREAVQRRLDGAVPEGHFQLLDRDAGCGATWPQV